METTKNSSMKNIEKLEQVGILGDVRQRMGAADENDTSQDERINRMSNSDLIAKWSGWTLGDEQWWYDMKANFDELEQLDNGKTPRQLAEQNKELLEALKGVIKHANYTYEDETFLAATTIAKTAIKNAEQ